MTRKIVPDTRALGDLPPRPVKKRHQDQDNQLTACDCCGITGDPATMDWLADKDLFCCRDCQAEEAACGCSDEE